MRVTFLLSLAQLALSAPTADATTVRASTGYYSGVINDTYPDVRAFLSVPYGQSTGKSGRFLPPVPVPASSDHIDATQYPPACPQYVTATRNIWNQEIPWYLQYWGVNNLSAGILAPFASEDCLKLAIWTPANATSASNLPVAMFWTGGGFQTNGILVPGQLPPSWVSRTQSHVVVTINYRMNILGFPDAGGIQDQNVGLLDQRLALEWVRDNIAYFGGDPSRIMIWGQSAGATSVDYYNYAYYEDPIASAMFCQSGNRLETPPGDVNHSNFTFVARSLGCDFPENATAELNCMQNLPYDDIINFMGRYQDNKTNTPPLSFNPMPDEKTVFRNNTKRYLTGQVSKVPMIYSSAANEGGSLSPFPADDPMSGVNQSVADATTIRIMCGAANSTALRFSIGLPTYRYQYAGNWTNQDPLPWMGAFHSSDLPMLFGAYADANNGLGGPTEEQTATAEAMQDLLYSFMVDPWNGPPATGWPQFDPEADGGGTILRFGADGQAAQQINADEILAVCYGRGEYDPFP